MGRGCFACSVGCQHTWHSTGELRALQSHLTDLLCSSGQPDVTRTHTGTNWCLLPASHPHFSFTPTQMVQHMATLTTATTLSHVLWVQIAQASPLCQFMYVCSPHPHHLIVQLHSHSWHSLCLCCLLSLNSMTCMHTRGDNNNVSLWTQCCYTHACL